MLSRVRKEQTHFVFSQAAQQAQKDKVANCAEPSLSQNTPENQLDGLSVTA
jgi:hypothetical protein